MSTQSHIETTKCPYPQCNRPANHPRLIATRKWGKVTPAEFDQLMSEEIRKNQRNAQECLPSQWCNEEEGCCWPDCRCPRAEEMSESSCTEEMTQ